jgi:hypothetical protein
MSNSPPTRRINNNNKVDIRAALLASTKVDCLGERLACVGKSSGLKGRRRTYHTILKLANHALFNMVRYVLLQPLRPELDGRLNKQTNNYKQSAKL